MVTAYLVARFTLRQNVPVFLDLDIYSEPRPTASIAIRCWVVSHVQADTLELATMRLEHMIATELAYLWCRPHIEQLRKERAKLGL